MVAAAGRTMLCLHLYGHTHSQNGQPLHGAPRLVRQLGSLANAASLMRCALSQSLAVQSEQFLAHFLARSTFVFLRHAEMSERKEEGAGTGDFVIETAAGTPVDAETAAVVKDMDDRIRTTAAWRAHREKVACSSASATSSLAAGLAAERDAALIADGDIDPGAFSIPARDTHRVGRLLAPAHPADNAIVSKALYDPRLKPAEAASCSALEANSLRMHADLLARQRMAELGLDTDDACDAATDHKNSDADGKDAT